MGSERCLGIVSARNSEHTDSLPEGTDNYVSATRDIGMDFGDRTKLNTLTFGVILLMHVGAIAAPFFFTWTNLIVTVVVYWMAVSWGIGMGYHRLHTHRGYRVPKWLEYFLAFCGTLALEGGPIYWVAAHRCHHQHSDTDLDPHTPRHGGFWAHMGWIIFGKSMHSDTALAGKYAPDLRKERFYRVLSEWHWIPLTLLGLVTLIFGGIGMLLWVVPLRIVVGLHTTWLVNSATHMWGSRRFQTKDDSRNLWWVALITFGEGWHNNHHAHPVSARHGMAWYELDISYLQIRLLEKLGLAKAVYAPSLESLETPEPLPTAVKVGA